MTKRLYGAQRPEYPAQYFRPRNFYDKVVIRCGDPTCDGTLEKYSHDLGTCTTCHSDWYITYEKGRNPWVRAVKPIDL